MISSLKPVLRRLRFPSQTVQLVPSATLVRSLLPIIVLAIAITAMITLFLWKDQASYKPLFGAKERVAASDIVAVLDSEHIPYHLHPDSGQVLVPEGMVGKARMLLAAKGVMAKLPAGLELMDHNDPLGVSQFVQDVRFRRALEGELVQSIMTLDAVESARVHLSIAKSSSFVVNDADKSSASVVIALKSGRSLGSEQIAAIINLVAGSVANLDPQRISLVDQAGNLLSARVDLSDGFDANQGNEAARRIQEETRKNIRELLDPVVGNDNYRISVTAEVDNDRVNETHEQYGATPKVTNEAMREELDRDRLAIGVPGSLSNRPVNANSSNASATGGAAAAGNAAPATSAPSNEPSTAQKSATTRQYAYDRDITQIKRSRGRLRRLNVAVILNNAAAPAGRGVWSPEELAKIENVLQSGLGVDVARGDKLAVSSLAFPAKASPEAWWERRDNIVEGVSWLSYAAIMLLGYLLLARPVLRMAKEHLVTNKAAPIQTQDVWADEEDTMSDASALEQPLELSEGRQPLGLPSADGKGMPVVPLLQNYDLPPPGSPVDVLVDHLKLLAAKEPERVAEVVKQWVQKNGQPQ